MSGDRNSDYLWEANRPESQAFPGYQYSSVSWLYSTDMGGSPCEDPPGCTLTHTYFIKKSFLRLGMVPYAFITSSQEAEQADLWFTVNSTWEVFKHCLMCIHVCMYLSRPGCDAGCLSQSLHLFLPFPHFISRREHLYTYHAACLKARGQLTRIVSLFPLCGSWGSVVLIIHTVDPSLSPTTQLDFMENSSFCWAILPVHSYFLR